MALSVFKLIFSPLSPIDTVRFSRSCLATTSGSRSTGNEGTRSTAFLISAKTTLISSSSSISTDTVPVFSDDMDVNLSMPCKPLRLSSIFRITPSSTSCGEAPGYMAVIVIVLGGISGKNEEFILDSPCHPPKMIAIINTLTATGYFIKYSMTFFISSLI